MGLQRVDSLRIEAKDASFDQRSSLNRGYLLAPYFPVTVKPVLSRHSKIDKTKVLKTNGSLIKGKSIAKCTLGAFCNTFDLH